METSRSTQRPWWLKWVLLGVVLCAAVAYFVFLQQKVPEFLELVQRLRARRYEPAIVLAFFCLAVVAPPLATIPSGAVMLTSATIGYIYGLWGLLIAWPGSSLGLALNFTVGRLSSASASEHDADGTSLGAPPEDRECCCIRGHHTETFLRAVRRLVRDEPKKFAVLLALATHSPATLFLLGWGTAVPCLDALLACLCAGIKVTPVVIKGMLVRDVMHIATLHGSGESCWKDKGLCVGIVVNTLVVIAFIVALFLLGRTVLRELHDIENETEGLCAADCDSHPKSVKAPTDVDKAA